MLVTASFFIIGLGVYCFYDKDLAWTLYELDSRFWGRTPVRGKNWHINVNYASMALVLLGMIGMMNGLQLALA